MVDIFILENARVLSIIRKNVQCNVKGSLAVNILKDRHFEGLMLLVVLGISIVFET